MKIVCRYLITLELSASSRVAGQRRIIIIKVEHHRIANITSIGGQAELFEALKVAGLLYTC